MGLPPRKGLPPGPGVVSVVQAVLLRQVAILLGRQLECDVGVAKPAIGAGVGLASDGGKTGSGRPELLRSPDEEDAEEPDLRGFQRLQRSLSGILAVD